MLIARCFCVFFAAITVQLTTQISGAFSPLVATFDVATLKMTEEGEEVLRDQLCPLLEDDKTTKVTTGRGAKHLSRVGGRVLYISNCCRC